MHCILLCILQKAYSEPTRNYFDYVQYNIIIVQCVHVSLRLLERQQAKQTTNIDNIPSISSLSHDNIIIMPVPCIPNNGLRTDHDPPIVCYTGH